MTAALEAEVTWLAIKDQWRAQVGRLQRGNEARLRRLTDRFGGGAVGRAIAKTAGSGLRRTPDRWGFFLALFGEVP
jgi:hypothetical protein